ncbi:DUF4230 domain-containing protein [Neisseria sp. N95_16]|uniref:DUF4230 domain-containing protein n=1 Tax=Neisseria brasiliensis TaxID=2666100 RepID=A0A7X2H042_9NEIS|nr:MULTISPECIES: DUF4230 domain-containing protein [Neisseria]MRN39118.1 DUF4230 domain-containing protein [Neisseria brasiliensis]PJO10214.1 DUF4230 domain-containing protein [Neisseria sp. N95_16]
MKTFFRGLLVLLLVAAAAAGGWFYHERVAQERAEVLSREGVLTQIKQLNRLESTAFYIDTIIRTEKKGDWRKLWQDAQSGLFIVRGKVLAGVDLDKITADNVNIIDEKVIVSLPEVEILSVDLEDIEVYDIQTGSLNILPMDKTVFKIVQEQARKQVLTSACKADILKNATTQAQRQLEDLFRLTQTQVSIYPAAVPVCK